MKQELSTLIRSRPVALLLGGLCAIALAAACGAAKSANGKKQSAQPRELKVLEYVAAEPLLLDSADMLAPLAMARVAWKGYLTQMSEPQGRTADLQSTYRMRFDDRALPWPSTKQHAVDGFDVKTRNIGSHAMLGAEKEHDPAKMGQLACVLTLTLGGAGSTVVHGELAENLLQLYETTGEEDTTDVKTQGLSTAPAMASNSTIITADSTAIPCDDSHILFAPYVWKRNGGGTSARAEATMPGAYLRAEISGSKDLAIAIDGTANAGCPPTSLPTIEYLIDRGEFLPLLLKPINDIYELPMSNDLDPHKSHQLEIVFRAADLTADRWNSPKSHLRIAGLRGDAGIHLEPCARRPHSAIAFGDSITEGVGVDGLFKSWQKLEVNNAHATWFPLVASVLGCEFGQLGSGGHGMTRTTLELPPLGKTWDHYDATTSRLVNGRLEPEPDYIFCALGTNDFDLNIQDDYVHWLAEMRVVCPNARFFCIVPPLGVHRDEISAAVAIRNETGDPRVHLIDTKSLQNDFTSEHATCLAHDGVHPTVYGQAALATLVATEVQKVLDKEASE